MSNHDGDFSGGDKRQLEVKASSKEMEEKLKIATTQVKVMEVDIGKETDNLIVTVPMWLLHSCLLC